MSDKCTPSGKDLLEFRDLLLHALDGTCVHRWNLTVDQKSQLIAYAGPECILIHFTLERLS